MPDRHGIKELGLDNLRNLEMEKGMSGGKGRDRGRIYNRERTSTMTSFKRSKDWYLKKNLVIGNRLMAAASQLEKQLGGSR